MKRIFSLLMAAAMVTTISCSRHIPTNGTITIIPQPSKVEVCEGSFNLNPETAIVLHFEEEQLVNATNFFNGVAHAVMVRVRASVTLISAIEEIGVGEP